VLIALAFVLRVAAMIALHSWRHPYAMEHRSIAMSLLEGDGFAFGDFGYYGPSSVQSPPYPLFLAGLFKIFGVDRAGAYVAAMVINAGFGAIAVWLTYWLARTLGAGELAALIAAALCAIWPTQIYSATYAQAICMIVATQTAMIVFFYRATRTASAKPWIVFAVVAALGALTEPVLLPITLLSALLILIWPSMELIGRARIRNAAILALAMVVIIGPWTIRNRVVHGKWIPIKSTFWVNVWKGSNDYATGTDRLAISPEQEQRLRQGLYAMNDKLSRNEEEDKARQYATLTQAQLKELQYQPEARRDQIFKHWATSWIQSHPQQYLSLCATRLGKTIWIDWDNPKSHNVIYVVSRLLLLLGTAAGLVLAIRRRWNLAFPALLIGSCLMTYMLTLTAARFSIPFEPLQFCLSAEAVVALAALVVHRDRNATPLTWPVAKAQ